MGVGNPVPEKMKDDEAVTDPDIHRRLKFNLGSGNDSFQVNFRLQIFNTQECACAARKNAAS